MAGWKNGSRNQGEPRFCPDTKSAPHENALSQALDDYAFLQIALEMRKRTAWIGGSITPLCSIDANFTELKANVYSVAALNFKKSIAKN